MGTLSRAHLHLCRYDQDLFPRQCNAAFPLALQPSVSEHTERTTMNTMNTAPAAAAAAAGAAAPAGAAAAGKLGDSGGDSCPINPCCALPPVSEDPYESACSGGACNTPTGRSNVAVDNECKCCLEEHSGVSWGGTSFGDKPNCLNSDSQQCSPPPLWRAGLGGSS